MAEDPQQKPTEESPAEAAEALESEEQQVPEKEPANTAAQDTAQASQAIAAQDEAGDETGQDKTVEDDGEADERSAAFREKLLKSQAQTGTISEALGRRNFMWALIWVGVIAVGVIGEQIKTRWENAQRTGKANAIKEVDAGQVQFYVTQSGLKYGDIKPGTGQKPEFGDLCLVQYTLRLEDGTKVVSSRDLGQKALAFRIGTSIDLPDQVPPGLDEGVSTMKEGGKRRLILPPELGFGDRPKFYSADVTVEPNSTLIYDIELVKVGNILPG